MLQISQRLYRFTETDNIGIDLGIKDLCITSDGKVYENLKIIKKYEKQLVKLQDVYKRQDYICKHYDIDILIAKINGLFKRKYALDEIGCDNLKLNNVTQTLTVNQTPVNVTEKEFQLLKLLVENKGTTLKKEYPVSYTHLS